MLKIMIAGASLCAAALLRRAVARQQAEAAALEERMQAGAALARRVRNRRRALARTLSELGRLQASALDELLPALRGLLGGIRNLSLEAAADPQLPALSGRYWRQMPAARALYGTFGVRPGVVDWLEGGAAPPRALGISLGPASRALLDGRPVPGCWDADLFALGRLDAELVALSEQAETAARELAALLRRGHQELSALQVVVAQNDDYRSLSEFALPGAARSPRRLVCDGVRLAQTLALVATTPMRMPWEDAPVSAPPAPAPAGWRAAAWRYCTRFRPTRILAGA